MYYQSVNTFNSYVIEPCLCHDCTRTRWSGARRLIGESNERRWAQSWAWEDNPRTRARKLQLSEQSYGGRMPLKALRSQRVAHARGSYRRPCYRGVRQ